MSGPQTDAHEHLEAELAWWTASNDLFEAAAVAAQNLRAGGPAIDPRELRNALGRFATGVCVVTTRAASGRTAGLTVNSFSAVSLDPPLVAWCLGRKAPSIQVFSEAEHFAVHVMAHDQHELAMHFARPADDKFAAVSDAFEPGIDNVPVLRDALARFECRKASMIDGGDHVIFLGRVERFVYADRPPLLFHAGRFLSRA
ncbi:flavin reductase family protein [Pusillimonas noertemannii]|uniref:Flavin reductase (DIM6/NTAB) family NADH-FMN oxidoreductase RutF n=1 Tax=Pusillimonas noertemannii TaxID=305977 RepID=A0A2U1CKT8_9BURK|nr:flavin reductase family protein [Pusillimonas noertemannii]NYT69159.1 flavin reductase family protein [Pusillimonas noertemannii]PVY61626.1 flavin reductase (DIM6/NTAB) family NADH-FMN oxidoreductase RutF [Pusillimonas noertemannii]TFL09572.1 flavin reductase [Pusillimonas noertemannii]